MNLLKSPARIIILVLGLLALLFFMSYSHIGPFAHDIIHVADYPGAQQVKVTEAEKVSNSYTPHIPYKTVTFTTSDPPDRVFTFYKNDLAGRGTEDWRTNSAEKSSGLLEIYGSTQQDFGPLLRFKVRTEQKDGLTYVTIERSYEPGL